MRGPRKPEDPSDKFLKISNMRSISPRIHEMDISKSCIFDQYLQENMKLKFHNYNEGISKIKHNLNQYLRQNNYFLRFSAYYDHTYTIDKAVTEIILYTTYTEADLGGLRGRQGSRPPFREKKLVAQLYRESLKRDWWAPTYEIFWIRH